MSKELDQFFTPPETARKCWAWLHEQLGEDKGKTEINHYGNRFYIEPSAGLGAFLKLMPVGLREGYEIDASLTAKRDPDLFCFERDFLTLTAPKNPPNYEYIVVGNPPFGHRGDLALKFINHSFALVADYVAFILPGAFVPEDDGEPPVMEKRIKGGYSIAHLPVPDQFELPEGEKGNKDISGCAFVLYKRGSRPSLASGPLLGSVPASDTQIIRHAVSGCDFYVRGDLGRPEVRDGVRASVEPLPAKWSPVGVKLPRANSCDSYVKIYSIYPPGKSFPQGQRMDKKERCHLFIPDAALHGQRHLLKATEEMRHTRGKGIEILRDHEAVKKHLLEFDWLSVARQSVNASFGITTATIAKAVIAGGFRDLAPGYDEVLAKCLAMNWKPYIRRTPTNFGHITKAMVAKALADCERHCAGRGDD